MRIETREEEAFLVALLRRIGNSQEDLESWVNENVAKWIQAAERVERGYDYHIEEYESDIWSRQTLEDIIRQGPPTLAARIKVEIAKADRRFLSSTDESTRPLGFPDPGDFSFWWWRVPKKCRGDLKFYRRYARRKSRSGHPTARIRIPEWWKSRPTIEKLKAILEAHGKWLGEDRRLGLRANLTNADLRGGLIRQAMPEHIDLMGAILTRADLSDENLAGVHMRNADLEGAWLSWADLHGANLYQSNFAGASLRNANLSGAGLWEANLAGAHLDEANLENAGLRGANLQRAYLAGANVSGANFAEADLRNVHLASDAELTDLADLRTARNVDRAIFGPTMGPSQTREIRRSLHSLFDAHPTIIPGLRSLIETGRLNGFDISVPIIIARLYGYPDETATDFRENTTELLEEYFICIGLGQFPEFNPFAAWLIEWIDEWLASRPAPPPQPSPEATTLGGERSNGTDDSP